MAHSIIHFYWSPYLLFYLQRISDLLEDIWEVLGVFLTPDDISLSNKLLDPVSLRQVEELRSSTLDWLLPYCLILSPTYISVLLNQIYSKYH